MSAWNYFGFAVLASIIGSFIVFVARDVFTQRSAAERRRGPTDLLVAVVVGVMIAIVITLAVALGHKSS
jgi:hypothetical protein